MVDRLYENMLELAKDSQEQNSNSTLCNLNALNENGARQGKGIVIVHYVI